MTAAHCCNSTFFNIFFSIFCKAVRILNCRSPNRKDPKTAVHRKEKPQNRYLLNDKNFKNVVCRPVRPWKLPFAKQYNSPINCFKKLIAVCWKTLTCYPRNDAFSTNLQKCQCCLRRFKLNLDLHFTRFLVIPWRYSQWNVVYPLVMCQRYCGYYAERDTSITLEQK